MNSKICRQSQILGIHIRQQIAHEDIYRVRRNKQQKYKYTYPKNTLYNWQSRLWQNLAWGKDPKLNTWESKEWLNYLWGPNIPTPATHAPIWAKHINAILQWKIMTPEEKLPYQQQATHQQKLTGQNLHRREYYKAPYKPMILWYKWRWSGLLWG